MDNELYALEAKRKKYKQGKQGMMKQLLTGKIRLENASTLLKTEDIHPPKTGISVHFSCSLS